MLAHFGHHDAHGHLQPTLEHLCSESPILAWRFTKRQVGMPDECLLLKVSGNCWKIISIIRVGNLVGSGVGIVQAVVNHGRRQGAKAGEKISWMTQELTMRVCHGL